jgi:hypothetical protein
MGHAWKLDSRNEVHVSQQPEVHHATKVICQKMDWIKDCTFSQNIEPFTWSLKSGKPTFTEVKMK